MKTAAIAATLLGASLATSATALTILEEDAAAPGTVSAVTSSIPGTNFLGVTFDSQDEAPFSAFVRFEAAGPFDLYFTAYAPIAEDEVSGFTFYEVGGPTYTTQGNFCDDASLSAASETCDLVTGEFGRTAGAITPNDDQLTGSLFGTLSAGEYVLGFFESQSPQDVSAVFRVEEMAAVPVPAAGVLLLGALGGLGLMRRRQG